MIPTLRKRLFLVAVLCTFCAASLQAEPTIEHKFLEVESENVSALIAAPMSSDILFFGESKDTMYLYADKFGTEEKELSAVPLEDEAPFSTTRLISSPDFSTVAFQVGRTEVAVIAPGVSDHHYHAVDLLKHNSEITSITSMVFDSYNNLYVATRGVNTWGKLFYITVPEEQGAEVEVQSIRSAYRMLLKTNKAGDRLLITEQGLYPANITVYDIEAAGQLAHIARTEHGEFSQEFEFLECLDRTCELIVAVNVENPSTFNQAPNSVEYVLHVVGETLQLLQEPFESRDGWRVTDLTAGPFGEYYYTLSSHYDSKEYKVARISIAALRSNQETTSSELLLGEQIFDSTESSRTIHSSYQKKLIIAGDGSVVYLSHPGVRIESGGIGSVIEVFSTKPNDTYSSSSAGKHNASNPRDVDGDGSITPADILAMVNPINRYGVNISVAELGEESDYVDVNYDAILSTIDLVLVLDYFHGNNSKNIADLIATLNYSFQEFAADVDRICQSISMRHTNGILRNDINFDQRVDLRDLHYFLDIIGYKAPSIGDANNAFSKELVRLFQFGKYETGKPALYSEGDFNCDGEFTSADLLELVG